MTTKISKKQQIVLNKMEENKWYSAYDLRCSIPTLRALQSRGMVKSKGWNEPGAFSMERTHIQWSILTVEF